MDIKEIYEKSTELTNTTVKKPLFMVMFYIQIMGLLISQIGTFFGFLGLFISSIMSYVLLHGLVCASLKAINGREIDINEDGRCGFRRFFELLKTYGWMYVIRLVVMAILLMVPVIILISQMFDFAELQSFSFVQELELETMMRRYILITMACEFIANILVNFIYFPTAYLIETQKLCGLKALKAGFKLLKKNRKYLFRLEMQYLSYMVIFLCLEFYLAVFVDNMLVIPFTFILYGLEAYMYGVHYQISHAYLFLEMEGERQ